MYLRILYLLPFITVLLASFFALPSCSNGQDLELKRLVVAVAANAQPALEEIEVLFEKEHPQINVILSSGSSGTLMRQASEGAPFDIFLSANDAYTQKLVERDKVSKDSVMDYAEGRLVIVKAPQRPEAIPELAEIGGEDFPVQRLAIANPQHAPYGMAAREAMQRAGVWDKVQRGIVFGENVGQAFHYASSGNADLAVIPLSLAIANSTEYREVDPSLYDPIVQSGGIITSTEASQEAESFLEFLSSPPSVEVLERYGYGVPGN